MRLLLDEHLSKEIAEQLRLRCGHDVVSVTERDDLRGLPDDALLNAARAEGRALVTESVRDFVVLARETVSAGEHHGIVPTSRRSFPRSAAGAGRLVAALAAYLDERPGNDVLVNQVDWLPPP